MGRIPVGTPRRGVPTICRRTWRTRLSARCRSGAFVRRAGWKRTVDGSFPVSYNGRMEKTPATAFLIHRGKRHEVRAGSTLRDAILKIGLSPEAVLASRRGELITDDTILREGDEIRLIAVISGG